MRTLKCVSAAVLAALIVGGSPAPRLAAQKTPGAVPTDARDPQLNQGAKTVAVGDKAMVATQLPIVTDAAVKVLRDGGNAVDALITATFLQCVVDYHQVSIFGAASGLYYEASSGKYYHFSGVSSRPRADRSDKGDPNKVAIAGKARMLEALAKRFGTRPWASYIQPAIAAAEEGVVVTSFMYANNYDAFDNAGELVQNQEAREFYMPDGFLVPVGQRWKMPKLAETLRKIASEGADYLYTGAWGQKFVAEANKHGGRVTAQDMAEYQVQWEEPVRFTYRGHEIIASPPPDTGGAIVGANLKILENFDLKKMGHYSESADTLEVMARTMGLVEADTRWAIQDPLNFKVPTALWLSPEYGKLGAEYVRNTMPRLDLSRATTEMASADPLFSNVHGQDSQDLGSNQDVLADAKGNWISVLHTGHGGAPGVLIDGVKATGSGARGSTTGPGRRVILPITSILIAQNGKPWMATGTPGFPPQPITELLVNLLDFNMPPKEAADAPRFWAFRNEKHDVEIESRISKAVRDGMKARGIKLVDLGPYLWHTGSMQIVWRDAATGKLNGVTDPRRLGLAAGF
jgi:gamma-glutamyltranspeptidase / glutathione hydrolase